LDEIRNLPIESLVYLDESGIDNNENYPYGYSLKGTRFFAEKQAFCTKRLSILASLNCKNIIAPFVFDGYCNTELFVKYIENILVPELKPNQIVIMDNATFHKSPKVQEAIEGAGCRLIYLPPYSPDLNPIEHYWHKIKNKIRKFLDNKFDFKNAVNEVFASSR
jgi:transposase